ncbi:MAG: riboflavin synthase [Oscillospiraceae bacterium]|jgi:riboflavin synthase
MFTGLVEELGTVRALQKTGRCAVLTIDASAILDDLKIGDSVAVNGVCLTVTSLTGKGFTADVMHETVERSGLFQLQPGSPVNLERAMRADGRFGGHIVAGHIDGTGRVRSVRRDENALWFQISAPPDILRYVVEKGSVAVDGVSLTVASVTGGEFAVSVIPHTAERTVLGSTRPGSTVNLECDLIGKYVEKLLGKTGGLTKEFLAKYDF